MLKGRSHVKCSHTHKGHKETLGGDRHVYYLECGDGITGIYKVCKNSTNWIRQICAGFCISIISYKAVKEKVKINCLQNMKNLDV